MTSATAGDKKRTEEALLKARAELKMSDQATISRRVASEIEGVISASTIFAYF